MIKRLFNLKNKTGGVTMKSMLWRMVLIVALPMMALVLLAVSIEVLYATNYNAILNNVTLASEFNQNFKSDIDLKMYYFVIDSQYSEGIPVEEVRAAEKLAETLLTTTTEKESIKAITSVQSLCSNLEEKMYQIADCEGYDERQEQLDNNIYILTGLIQDYMYTYLYHEAAHLKTVNHDMVQRLAVFICGILILTFVLTLVLLNRSRKLGDSIATPINELCSRVRAIGGGDLKVCSPIQADEVEIQTLSNGFEQMVERLNLLISKNRDEEKQRRNAELALLQAQINPHFLYNTLDAIIWLIESGKYDESVDMVSSLSAFFRHSLSRGMDMITISEDEQHVRSYLEIQRMRYADILDYEIRIPSELGGCELPKLTLQPLVENALYHGIKLKRRKGHITVTGELSDGLVIIYVDDDGAGMSAERLSAMRETLSAASSSEEAIGFGMRTVHKRLQLLFGEDYGLKIDSEEGVGTRITAVFPAIYKTAKETEE